MSKRQLRLPKEEHAKLGREMYELKVRPLVETENQGRIVAIDVDSGDFELDDSTIPAVKRLLSRRPDAQIWCVRIGSPGLHRFGWRTSVSK